MTEKKFGYGAVNLTRSQLKEIDPMAESLIDDDPKPIPTKGEKAFSDLLLIWLGIWIGGLVVYFFLKH